MTRPRVMRCWAKVGPRLGLIQVARCTGGTAPRSHVGGANVLIKVADVIKQWYAVHNHPRDPLVWWVQCVSASLSPLLQPFAQLTCISFIMIGSWVAGWLQGQPSECACSRLTPHNEGSGRQAQNWAHASTRPRLDW
jgi:hypothetical protein